MVKGSVLVAYIYNTNTEELGVGGPEVPHHVWLYRKLKINLEYVRPCLKNTKRSK